VACGGVHKDEETDFFFGGSKTLEGANFWREQNFGGRILFWDKHNCSHVGGANVYLAVHTKGVVWEGVLERVLRDGKPCLSERLVGVLSLILITQ